MLQAVQAPVLKLAAVAGAALLIGVVAASSHAHDGAVVQRLELHAPEQPGALYLTAWSEGDVFVTVRDGAPRTLMFQTRAFINDGCEWLATEKLYPDGADRYFYTYDEEILSCEPGATPALKTPRTGYAIVVDTH